MFILQGHRELVHIIVPEVGVHPEKKKKTTGLLSNERFLQMNCGGWAVVSWSYNHKDIREPAETITVPLLLFKTSKKHENTGLKQEYCARTFGKSTSYNKQNVQNAEKNFP